MPPERLDDKYRPSRLHADELNAELIHLMAAGGAAGSVFHVLRHIPEQGEDLYTILVDDRMVVHFEVPRRSRPPIAEDVRIVPLAQYRHGIGQGRARIRLDRAVEDARRFLAK